MSASNLRVSRFLAESQCLTAECILVLNLCLDPNSRPPHPSPTACLPRTAAPALRRGPFVPRNCKIARKCGPVQSQALRACSVVRKSRGGSSSKLCQSVYRRRTQVWRMDLSELGAEFGSCGYRWQGKHTEEMQNRPEVRSLGMDWAREGSYGAEVEGWVILQTLSERL